MSNLILSSEQWASHSLFSQPDLYELLLCHNYHIYLNTIKKIISDNSKILYPGCGTGKFSKLLADCGYKIFAFDINQKAIHYAKIKNKNQNIFYFTENMCNPMNAFSEYFDVIISLNNTFRHLLLENEIKLFFETMNKRLKPGGQLIIHLGLINNLDPQEDSRKWTINLKNIKSKTETKLNVEWKIIESNKFLTKEELNVNTNQQNNKLNNMTYSFSQKNWTYKKLKHYLSLFGFKIETIYDDYGNKIKLHELYGKNVFIEAKKVKI